MTAVHLPDELRDLLRGASCEAATLGFGAAAETILADNKTPFFPAFTDHGPEHVRRVIATCARLVPRDVWSSGILRPEDACTLVCAAYLHDLALHLRDGGFLALVGGDAPHPPVAWFAKRSDGRRPDLLWPAAWQAFRHDARHLNQSQLDRLLGPRHDGPPAVAFGTHDENPSAWTDNDRLLIGDFLRRHHARLAHEIALYGLPGVAAEGFPVLRESLPSLAPAIGIVARSHNEPLRTMVKCCEHHHGSSKRPWGALVPYLMGVLRVADYLQLDADRAPPLLLRLKNPPSRVSVDEWNKHGAIGSISWDEQDPLAVYVQAGARHSLRTHLQLVDLVADLQREMDVTAAVLSEVYATGDLARVRLAKQRVRTNLDEAALHDELPYIARRAALRSDEDLFRLMISDLYGDEPAVAGRELVQNAVDAVRDRWRWEAEHGPVATAGFRDCEADVAVYLEQRDEHEFRLRVVDTGIGMTADVIERYYLRAGATFGPTPADLDELPPELAAQRLKAGRFGIGAFAGFLLGATIEVQTRHVAAERGIAFAADLDAELVELRWADIPCGTQVEIPFRVSRVGPSSRLMGSTDLSKLLSSVAGLYRLARPVARFFYVSADDGVQEIDTDADVPAPGDPLSDTWREVATPPGFDAVLWAVDGRRGQIIHNGILIRHPDRSSLPERADYGWSTTDLQWLLRQPTIAVFDSQHALGLTLNRFALKHRVLPFERELLGSVGKEVVASSLVAPRMCSMLGIGWGLRPVFKQREWLPLAPTIVAQCCPEDICVRWHAEHRRLVDTAGQRLDGAFTAPASHVSWDAFPARTVLDMITEFHTFGMSEDPIVEELGNIEASVHELAARLGRTQVVSVVMGISSEQQQAAKSAIARGQLGVGLRWDAADVVQPPAYGFSMGRGHEPDVERALRKAAATLATSSGQIVALSVLRAEHGPPDYDRELSEAWMRLVKGGLPRDRAECELRRDEICAAAPDLRSSVEAWDRLGQACGNSDAVEEVET